MTARPATLGLLCGALLAVSACHPTTIDTPPAPRAITPTHFETTAPTAVDSEAFRRFAPAPGTPTPVEIPAPEVSTLKNGLLVVSLTQPAGLVSLSVAVRHGASDAPRGQSGLVALLARMLPEGSRRLTGDELAERTESLGSTLYADANRDYFTVALTVLEPDIQPGFALLTETLLEPGLREADVARVRQQFLDELVAERQSPSRIAALVGLQALFGPELGAPVHGHRRDVERLTADHLRAWHRHFVRPESMAVFAVGPLEHAELRRLASHHFSNTRGTSTTTVQELSLRQPKPAPGLYLLDRPESVQSSVFVGQLAPRREEPGHEAREVLVNVLSGLFTSRINRNLRERHAFTYGAQGTLVATRSMGALVIQTNVQAEVTADALRELNSEITALRRPGPLMGATGAPQPVTQEEFQAARTDLVRGLVSRREHPRKLATDLEALFAVGLPMTYHRDYPALLERLTMHDLDDASLFLRPPFEATRVKPSEPAATLEWVEVVVGDRVSLEPALRATGRNLVEVPASFLD